MAGQALRASATSSVKDSIKGRTDFNVRRQTRNQFENLSRVASQGGALDLQRQGGSLVYAKIAQASLQGVRGLSQARVILLFQRLVQSCEVSGVVLKENRDQLGKQGGIATDSVERCGTIPTDRHSGATPPQGSPVNAAASLYCGDRQRLQETLRRSSVVCRSLTVATMRPRLKRMEVHFSAKTEARLQQVASRTGRDAAQVVEEAVDRMLEYEIGFVEAVEKGRTSARRGDLLEHDEVVERIEGMFRP
jgi:predicted transcriptional regulator